MGRPKSGKPHRKFCGVKLDPDIEARIKAEGGGSFSAGLHKIIEKYFNASAGEWEKNHYSPVAWVMVFRKNGTIITAETANIWKERGFDTMILGSIAEDSSLSRKTAEKRLRAFLA